MKIKLTPQDFELKTLEENNYQYFSCYTGTREVTIEPTDLGYLVCVYDDYGILVGRRKPVLFSRYSKAHECFASAVKLASEINISMTYGNGALREVYA